MLLALAPVLLATAGGTVSAQDDPRDVRAGRVLPDEGYCDQPLVARLSDGTWLTVITTGAGSEGEPGQHVVARTTRDRGQTWSKPVDVEPADGPAASWGQPLATPAGRVFVFYVLDDTGLDDRRSDMMGAYVMRWSDDGGRTWSKRARIPVRVTAIDRGNDFEGEILMHWGVGKPLVDEETVLVPFTKIGKYLVEETEAWFLASPDLLAVEDPRDATWETRPEGEHGLRAEGPIASEPCLAHLPDGRLACVVRTVDGHPLLATSADGGRAWSEPAPARDLHGRAIPHPRACARLWRVAEGRYVLWTHEVSTPTWAPGTRNPAWLRGGTIVDGALRFGPPEIALYDRDPEVRISYPDLVLEEDGAYLLETQKSVARVHRVEPDLLASLFGREPRPRGETTGLVDEGEGGARLRPAPDLEGGWTFEAWIEPAEAPVLLARAADGERAVSVSTTDELGLVLELEDGDQRTRHASQPDVLPPGAPHHVAVVVDARANVVRWLVDGRVLDGGEHAPRGWSRLERVPDTGPDEKLLLEDDADRTVVLDDGDRFDLGAPDADNALLVPIGEARALAARYGHVARVGILTTGVGFQPPEDPALPVEGVLRLHYADGFQREHVWDLRDSDGSGRGTTNRIVGKPWTLVRTDDGKRWTERHVYAQSVSADPGRDLVRIELDATSAVDAAGDDAVFALLAVSTTSATAASRTPLAPVYLDPEDLDGDVLATHAHDGRGRGFRERDPAPSVVDAAAAVLEETPLVLGAAVTDGAHFGRALLAAEVTAIFRSTRR